MTMEGIDASIKKLDVIVNDLNDILQVQHISNEHKDAIFLEQLITEVKKSIRDINIRDDIHIECRFGVAYIMSIKRYLFSIFYNLILNSIEYQEPARPLSIRIENKTHDGAIQFIITDNGRGINLKKNSSDLFALYKRFNPELGSRGIGLFVVKTQVELLGGTIHLKSQPGKGTSFTILLPVQE